MPITYHKTTGGRVAERWEIGRDSLKKKLKKEKLNKSKNKESTLWAKLMLLGKFQIPLFICKVLFFFAKKS